MSSYGDYEKYEYLSIDAEPTKNESASMTDEEKKKFIELCLAVDTVVEKLEKLKKRFGV